MKYKDKISDRYGSAADLMIMRFHGDPSTIYARFERYEADMSRELEESFDMWFGPDDTVETCYKQLCAYAIDLWLKATPREQMEATLNTLAACSGTISLLRDYESFGAAKLQTAWNSANPDKAAIRIDCK